MKRKGEDEMKRITQKQALELYHELKSIQFNLEREVEELGTEDCVEFDLAQEIQKVTGEVERIIHGD